MAFLHRQCLGRNAVADLVVAVRDVNVRPEHVVIADLDITTGVNHDVAVEIISVSNADTDSVMACVLRPQPTTLRERVEIADLDLAHPPAASPALHAIANALLHPEDTISRQAYPAGEAARNSQKQ